MFMSESFFFLFLRLVIIPLYNILFNLDDDILILLVLYRFLVLTLLYLRLLYLFSGREKMFVDTFCILVVNCLLVFDLMSCLNLTLIILLFRIRCFVLLNYLSFHYFCFNFSTFDLLLPYSFFLSNFIRTNWILSLFMGLELLSWHRDYLNFLANLDLFFLINKDWTSFFCFFFDVSLFLN